MKVSDAGPIEIPRRLQVESFLEREDLPWLAAFLAGKAQVQYRRLGGTRHTTLSDFFIGAHALVSGYYLLTRDSRRFETYFPAVEVMSPDTHP